jgi:putative membrane-bound dehydrogenase-like protein
MSHRAVATAAVALASILLATTAPAGDQTVNNRTFHLPDGFTIELAAAPPLADRPIICDLDEQGRLYVADSSGSSAKVQQQLEQRPHRIVRLEDTDGDGVFDKQTVFADKMMFPEGAMWHAGSLYVAAPPSIWKLTDTDNDGVADQRVEWFQGKTLTGCANDLHGPYNGPDGMIYWTKGAFAKQTYTLPNGKPFTTRASHIFRATPDGQNIEPVMTGGMDNPVEVAFTPGGERIFTTTFLQNPANGKRDGLIHAIYGGVYGKVHDVIDGHVRTGPDLMPVLAHLGPAAPSGLTRYESQVFGKGYQDNLFSTSFNLRKVFRHQLTPDGATFKATVEDFLTSDHLDFHPTHVLEDADGSLLVVDTGGWYKLCCPTSQLQKPDILGAIYRVRRTDAPKVDDPRGLKLSWSTMTATDLAKLLADPRPAVQKRATAMLATTPNAVAAIEKFVQASDNPRARTNAVWALCRIPGSEARAATRAALTDKDATVVQAAAHAISLWRDRGAVLELVTYLHHPSVQVRRTVAEALGRIGDARAIPALLAAVAKPADRVIEHSFIYALIEINDPAATKTALDAAPRTAFKAGLIALDQMGDPKLAAGPVLAAMTAADPGLREAGVWIASRHPQWGDAIATRLRDRLAATDLTDEARADLVEQLAKLAKSDAVQKLLADHLRDEKAPAAGRRLALAAMADAGLAAPPAAWVEAVGAVAADGPPDLAPTAVATARRFAARKGATTPIAAQLLKAATRGDLPPAARLDALAAAPAPAAGAGAAATSEVFTFLLSQVASDQPLPQRMAAAEALAKAKLSSPQLTSLTAIVKDVGPLELDRLLAAFDQSSDDAVGETLVSAFETAKTPVRPETLRPHLKKFGPEVQKRADALFAKASPDAAVQRARVEQVLATLNTGDVRRGQAVFNSAKAACVSCHTIGYVGGHVGPDLSRVGAIRQERDLVESIVFPSASFVQSYEPIVVETVDGDVQNGVMRRNDAEEILLLAGPDRELHIPRADVKAVRPGALSVMPAGLDQQLTPQELADLVTFLKNCK